MTVAFILFLIFAIYNKRIMIKLLLVEDDASLRYIVQGGLEDMIGGYEVIAAANVHIPEHTRSHSGSL